MKAIFRKEKKNAPVERRISTNHGRPTSVISQLIERKSIEEMEFNFYTIRVGNYYPTCGYPPCPNSVGSGLKSAPAPRWVGTRAGLYADRVGIGFKANPPLPYPHPIYI